MFLSYFDYKEYCLYLFLVGSFEMIRISIIYKLKVIGHFLKYKLNNILIFKQTSIIIIYRYANDLLMPFEKINI